MLVLSGILGPVGAVDVGIHQLSIKIQPDPPVRPAVEGTAGRRPVLIDCAAHGVPIHVDAVTVVALVNEIGLAKSPVNDPLPYVLPGQGEWDPAAGPEAEVEPARAVKAHLLAEGVLVVFGILEHDAHALLLEFFHQQLPHHLFPLVKFLDGDHALFAQKLDEGVKIKDVASSVLLVAVLSRLRVERSPSATLRQESRSRIAVPD